MSSPALPKRRSGCFCRQRTTISRSPRGTRATAPMSGGSVMMMCIIVSVIVSPMNGRCPASIS